MRTNNEYTLLEVLDQYVLAGPPEQGETESTMFNLNATAAFLWENLQGKDFSINDMVAFLVNEYSISELEAQCDSTGILKQWIETGLVVKS